MILLATIEIAADVMSETGPIEEDRRSATGTTAATAAADPARTAKSATVIRASAATNENRTGMPTIKAMTMVAGKENGIAAEAGIEIVIEDPVIVRDFVIEEIGTKEDAVEDILQAPWMRAITLIATMSTSISRSLTTTSSSVVWHHK